MQKAFLIVTNLNVKILIKQYMIIKMAAVVSTLHCIITMVSLVQENWGPTQSQMISRVQSYNTFKNNQPEQNIAQSEVQKLSEQEQQLQARKSEYLPETTTLKYKSTNGKFDHVIEIQKDNVYLHNKNKRHSLGYKFKRQMA